MNTHARGVEHQRVPAHVMTPFAHAAAGLVSVACSVARKQRPPSQPLCSPAPSRQSGGSRVSACAGACACRGPRVPGSACAGVHMCQQGREHTQGGAAASALGSWGQRPGWGPLGSQAPPSPPTWDDRPSFTGVSPRLAWWLELRRVGRVLHPGWDTGTHRLGNPSVRDGGPAAWAELSGRHRGPAASPQAQPR